MSYYAEATPDGIKVMSRNDAGINEAISFIAYGGAVTHIERTMIERYGTGKGTEKAIAFYIAMLDANCRELTALGSKALTKFVKMFHQRRAA